MSNISEMKPADLTAMDQAFPATVMNLMPDYKDIPEEFRRFRPNDKWQKIFSDFFYYGAENINWKAKDGIDRDKAIRHVRTIMGSYEPKHEHKTAACAYLMSLWFDDITYDKPKRDR